VKSAKIANDKPVAPTEANRGHKPATARDGSKKAVILALLGRPDGATLGELMAAAEWQAHSVRGFVSGALGNMMGLTVESVKRDDERVYRIAKSAALALLQPAGCSRDGLSSWWTEASPRVPALWVAVPATSPKLPSGS